MKRLLMATVLSLVLCVSASAGDIPSDGYAPPPPPPPTGGAEYVPGDVPTVDSQQQMPDTVDVLMGIILGLFIR